MIKVNRLAKVYQTGDKVKVNALDDVSFEIPDNQLLFIMGKSGSGKSTLLHLMGGLDRPSAGNILYNDVDITVLSENKLSAFRRDHIGFVFQDYNLVPELTAEENIKYPVYLSKKEIDVKLWDFLIQSLQIEDRLNHLPSQLSGGQQQRVAIARALINNPQIVLCDEPTGNLDSESGLMVQNVLFDLHSKLKKTLIIVTHDEDFSAKGNGRIIRLKDGRVE